MNGSILGRPLLDRFVSWSDRIPDRFVLGGAMLLAFAFAAGANYLVLDDVPHVTDDVAYLFMAKTFASGKLVADAPLLPEFFRPHFFYLEQGKFIPLFQFGWPLVLALGVLAGLPGLVNPLVGALTLIPVWRLATRAFGPRAARLTLIVLLLTPFYVFMAGSTMAHPLSGLLGLLALDQALAWRDDRRGRRLVLIGVLVGALGLVRLYNAALLALPLGVILWPALTMRPRPLGALALAALFVAAFASLQLALNVELTGDPLRFPQDEYFARTEKAPSCHRLGFGPDVGCENEHGQAFGFPDGYYLSDALGVTRQRLDSLTLNYFGASLALALIVLPLAAGRLGLAGATLYLHAVVLALGYALFYYHGNCYGPRFYYEAVGPLGALTAAGLMRLDRWFAALAARLVPVRRVLRALAPALALTLAVFAVFWLHPKLWDSYRRFRGLDGDLRWIVADAGIRNAVVLLPGSDVSYAYGLNFNRADFLGDVVFARHLFEQSTQLMYLHPDRDFYRFRPREKRLVRVRRLPYEGMIVVEAETKWPPAAVAGGVTENQWIRNLRPENIDAGQLYLDGEAVGASMTVEQYVFEPGEYTIEIEALTGPYLADWRLAVNGEAVGPALVGWAESYRFVRWRSERSVWLERGPASMTFAIVGRDDRAHGYGVGLDWFALRRVPDAAAKPLPRIVDDCYMDAGRCLPIPPLGPPVARRP